MAPQAIHLTEMLVKPLFTLACMLFASNLYAANCVTNRFGKTICSNGQSAVAVNPNTGAVATAQKSPTGATTVQTNTGAKAAYNPNSGAVATAQKSPSGMTTVQTNTGTKAAYNPHTGNAAVQQTNQNGVKTTQTKAGGTTTTKNGVGVATGPNGTTCVKGVHNQGCK